MKLTSLPSDVNPSPTSPLDFPSQKRVHITSRTPSTDNLTRLQKALGDKIVGVRQGIKSHTPRDDVVEIVNDVRAKGADILGTLCAGSLTDGAKIVLHVPTALANNVSTLSEFSRLTAESKPQNPKSCLLPVINIPTTLSGEEYSDLAGCTDTRTHHKVFFTHPSMLAQLVILDPALSTSTPERIWLPTGIRAVDHCVEGLCSLDRRAGLETDRVLTAGLKLLVPSLLLTKRKWEDEKARFDSMLGVIESMKGVSTGLSMGGSHGIGYQLGPLGVEHGETSCIMLPAVLKYNARHGDDEIRAWEQKVLNILRDQATVAEVLKRKGLQKETADAGDVVGAIISELGMPRTLNDVGVGREKLDDLAVKCLKDAWLRTNPVPLLEKRQVLDILEAVVGDGKSHL
ncbi:hypothetical protein IFR04_001582 [Cadophora malorum]|uniref:Alcohol dehydrogenase iron-type/glycerol dehydrogenase GldA domain-containing protein n=1 Tax=Cadophora malorum TaxID=108018 RepID=A0A8H7WI10_9HELO|nr:hypothetical protein IFR04_001582 [Cadophora malorum]